MGARGTKQEAGNVPLPRLALNREGNVRLRRRCEWVQAVREVPGQVCSDAASSHVRSSWGPVRAQSNPYVRVWLAAVGLFLVLQAFAPSPAKPSAASSQAGLWALSQQSEPPCKFCIFWL